MPTFSFRGSALALGETAQIDGDDDSFEVVHCNDLQQQLAQRFSIFDNEFFLRIGQKVLKTPTKSFFYRGLRRVADLRGLVHARPWGVL
jgi:hypothetical protein